MDITRDETSLTIVCEDSAILDLADRVGMTGIGVATMDALMKMAETVSEKPKIKYRVYFWLMGEGIDYNNRSEPWRFIDLDSEQQVRDFYTELEPLVQKWSVIAGESLPDHSDGLIKPPTEASQG